MRTNLAQQEKASPAGVRLLHVVRTASQMERQLFAHIRTRWIYARSCGSACEVPLRGLVSNSPLLRFDSAPPQARWFKLHHATFSFGSSPLWLGKQDSSRTLRIYGIGARCEIGNVRFRGVWTFEPEEIALVKEPYGSLFGFVWDVPSCRAETGEGSVALLFGEDDLFTLAEIVAEVEIPVSARSELSLAATVTTAGAFTLTFGWDLNL